MTDAPRPTTEEGRTDPLLRPHDESEGEPRSSTGSTGNDAHKTESDQRGTTGRDVGTLARPTTEEGRLREALEAITDTVYSRDASVESLNASYSELHVRCVLTARAALAAPPSEQEEPPATVTTLDRVEQVMNDLLDDTDGGLALIADVMETLKRNLDGRASTPVPALDPRPLMQALRDHLFPRGIHHPEHWSLTNEGAKAIGAAAQTIERRLSGDEGGAG